MARTDDLGRPRQARLDAYVREEPRRAPAPQRLAPAQPQPALRPAPPRHRRRKLLAEATPEALVRLERAAIEGLEAVGFDAPRLTLDVRPHASLRASLSQRRPGRIVRGEPLVLEITDGYAAAPERAVAGLAAHLGLRVLGRRRPGELAQLLMDYHDLWQRSREGRLLQTRVRRERARKQGRGPQGAAHDLDDIRARIARRFFADRLEPVEVTWSARSGYSTLGHHDGDLDTIVLSRALDHPDIPETVVAYILYHELLHHALGIEERPLGRRSLHPPGFRRRERRFPHWRAADAYLQAVCARRRPIPRARAEPAWRVLWDEPWDDQAGEAAGGGG